MLKIGKSRKLSVAVSVVICIAIATFGIVGASSTSKTLSTNFTVVNLSSSPAVGQVAYYKEDGNAWTVSASSSSFNLTGNGGQAIIRQYDDAVMTAGRGSAVVAANQALGAVVQILARNQTPTSGAYIGSGATDSVYYVPLVIRRSTGASGLSNSQIIIQNADSTAINVTVDLIKSASSPGANYQKIFNNIPVGTSVYYDLDDESSANVAVGWIGSAVVTGQSSKKIAVISNFFSGAHTLQTFNAFGASKLTNDWFVPLFTSRLSNGLSTPVVAQNLTGGTLAVGEIDLTCTKDPGSGGSNFAASNTATVANNELWAFNPVTDFTLPNNWFGSCRVAAPGNLAVFVQMRQPSVNANAGAYEAVPANGTDTIALIPLIAKRLANGFATAVTIQNLSTVLTATVDLHYVPSGGGPAIDVNGMTIPPGGSLIRNHRLISGPAAETALADGFVGSLVVTSTGGGAPPISGFVQLTNINPSSGDTFMAHGVFTKP